MIYTLTLNPALDREMTVPELVMDKVLRASTIRTDFGGKGFNVSRALLALGVESTALGFVGGGVGDQLAAGLVSLGIQTDFVLIKGETRINLSVVSGDHAHYIKVNEPGPTVTESETNALSDKVRKTLKAGDWLIVAGSPPPGVQPRFIGEIIEYARITGVKVALDMEGAYLRMGCISGAALVKPNAIEARDLTGLQIKSIDDAAHAIVMIHKIGAEQVVISLGKAGAVYSDGERIWKANPPQISERNPIGAGDAMLAGLVWSIQEQLDAKEVLRWGVACGAAAASLDGTAVGSLSLIQSLLPRVNVEENNSSKIKTR